MIIGGEVNFRVGAGFVLDDSANSISIGTAAQTLYPGTAVTLHGKSINLNTTNLTVRSQPMFISKTVSRAVDTTSITTSFDHGINTDQYDVFVTGFFSNSSTPVRSAYCYPYNSTAYIQYTTTPSSGTAYLWFLGIRKGLTDAQ